MLPRDFRRKFKTIADASWSHFGLPGSFLSLFIVLMYSHSILFATEASNLVDSPIPKNIILKDEQNQTSAYKHVEYFIDQSGTKDIFNIKKDLTINFQPYFEQKPNLDRVKNPVWFRFSVTNKTATKKKIKIINDNTFMSATFMAALNQYGKIISTAERPKPKSLLKVLSEFDQAKETSINSNRLVLLEFDLNRNQTYSVYVKLHSDFPKEPRFIVSFDEGYWDFEFLRQRFFASYFGSIFAILLFNTLVFFKLRRKAYFYYVLFGLSMTFNAFIGVGYAEQYLGDYLPVADIGKSTIVLPILLAIAFSRNFLETAIDQKARDLVLRIVFWACIASIPLRYLPAIDSYVMVAADILMLIFMVVIIRCGVYSMKKKNRPAAYFVLSWSILSLSAVAMVLQKNDLIVRNFLTQHVILIGQVAELLILSLALIEDYKILEKKKATAEALANESQELRTLVRVLSHDIVNPVAIIKGHAEIQLQIDPNNTGAKSWKKALKACKNIIDIVHSVRDMRSLKEGKMHVQIEPVKISELVAHLKFTFHTRFTEKHIQFNVFESGLEDTKIKANQAILKNQILNNIVSNAIKFSEEGAKLDLTFSKKGSQLVITLRDYGIGIPDSILVDIFDPTVSTSRPGTQGEKGTGYGMPLVKSFVEKFGGTIQIDSWTEDNPSADDDTGTLITISLNEWKSSKRDKEDDLVDESAA